MSAPDRRAMLDRADRTLSLRRQCALLGVARSGVYRPRKPANDNDAALMRWIDEPATAWPFLGSRRMTAMLRGEGVFVNRKRRPGAVASDGDRGARAAGREPASPRPATRSIPISMRNLTIERANHVWAADITYIPIGRGFLYLVAIIDWASRAVAWVAAVEHDGRIVLSGGARGGAGEVRQAGDFQHRPRLAVHFGRLHRARSPNCWSIAISMDVPRPLDGQRVHRAALAVAQVRGRLSQELRRWPRSRARHR